MKKIRLDEKAKMKVESIADAMVDLRELGVIRTQRFHADLGEWMVAVLMNGSLADDPNQKGWDLEIDGKRYQVKSHAKASTNKNRLSYVSGAPGDFHYLCIAVFSEEYKLRELYKVPAKAAFEIRTKNNIVTWSKIAKYKQDIKGMKNYRLVSALVDPSAA